MTLRQLCLLAHRYLGLGMATFLLIAGATGAILPYYHTLDAACNPGLHRPQSPAPPGASPLSPAALRAKLEAEVPGIHVPYLPLDTPPGEAIEFFVRPAVDPATGRPIPLVNDQYFLDPGTGEILGGRMRGDLRQGAKNILPFLYKLHYSLCLGPAGRTFFGIVALIWTLDCFIGAYLTFPPLRRAQGSGRGQNGWTPWLRAWGRAWLVRTGSLFKASFTWHRASGLWLWGMLLIFAWSAVGLNLGDVYFPAMNAVFGMKEGPFETMPRLAKPRWTHALTWEQGIHRGQELMRDEAARRGLAIDHEIGLSYMPAHGMFRYIVRSSLDVNERYANTAVWFSADSGELAAFDDPRGGATGNTIHTWIVALHFADVGGPAYRAFVSVLGLLVTVLTLSGVAIWWIKLQARRSAVRHSPAALEAAPSLAETRHSSANRIP